MSSKTANVQAQTFPSASNQAMSTVDYTTDDVFSTPVLVRSATLPEIGNEAMLVLLKSVPKGLQERPFLHCEVPFYLGEDEVEETLPAEMINESFQPEIRFLEVMSVKNMEDKSQKGFVQQDKIDLLEKLFPLKEFTQDKHKWKLEVSKARATSDDRLNLFKRYEAELQSKNCTEHGFCPTKEFLIQDLLDECIRQEILEFPERGILLAHIKNGFNRLALTLSALYESSQVKIGTVTTVFGAITDELDIALEKDNHEIQQLQARIRELELQNEDLRVKLQEERHHEQTKSHADAEFLRKYCAQAKEQVELFEHPSLKHSNDSSKKTASAMALVKAASSFLMLAKKSKMQSHHHARTNQKSQHHKSHHHKSTTSRSRKSNHSQRTAKS